MARDDTAGRQAPLGPPRWRPCPASGARTPAKHRSGRSPGDVRVIPIPIGIALPFDLSISRGHYDDPGCEDGRRRVRRLRRNHHPSRVERDPHRATRASSFSPWTARVTKTGSGSRPTLPIRRQSMRKLRGVIADVVGRSLPSGGRDPESGQTLAEYSLILSFIGVGVDPRPRRARGGHERDVLGSDQPSLHRGRRALLSLSSPASGPEAEPRR